MVDRGRSDLKRIWWYVLVLAAAWTAIIGGSLAWDFQRGQKTLRALARVEALSSWEKDLVFRRWAAGHGGVYVPTSRTTRPSPYLTHVPERDIVTPSGRSLTLINPAYMIRQMHGLGEKQYGLMAHITSLDPIRPENEADDWEKQALEAFDRGEKEVLAINQTIDGKPYLRVMRPVVTEHRCLKCHAGQGYKIGDIRGGVSISVPMRKYLDVGWADTKAHVIRHLVVWLLGLAALGLATAHVRRRVLERNRAEHQLFRSEKRFRALYNSMAELAVLLEIVHGPDGKPVDYRILDCNPTFCRVTGLEHEKAVGLLGSGFYQDQTPPNLEEYARTADTGQALTFEIHAARLDKHFSISTSSPAAGQCAVIAADITSNKKTEAQLSRLNRELIAISECNQTVVRATDEQSLLDDICRIVCEKAGYRMAWVGYAQNDENSSVRPVAWRGMDEDYLGRLQVAWDHSERGQGPTGRAVRSGKPCVVADYANDPSAAPWRGEAARCDIRSSISLPLLEDGKAFGVLKIYSSLPDAFTEQEIRLLTEMAGDLAFGIVSLRRKAKQKRMENINAARLRLLQYAADHSLADLLEQTLNEAEELTGSLIGFYHFVDADQQTLWLQNWSTRTKGEFCRAEGRGLHYQAAKAGVWADCLKERGPVIHNDYASLAHKKGMPPGHAEVVRELVVPVTRGRLVMAILGVGNKAEDYNHEDVEAVSLLADLAWEIAQRKKAEEEIIAREATLNGIYQASPSGIGLFSYPGRGIMWANQGLSDMTGYAPGELQGMKARYLFPSSEEYQKTVDAMSTVLDAREVTSFETKWIGKGGGLLDVMLTEAPLKPDNPAAGLVFTALDITASKQMAQERQALEAQLRQAQKMEAIGTLAGGIAHDFNNILSAVMGFSEMALEKAGAGEDNTGELERVIQSTERARDLVHQILTFSRKVETVRRPLDLNHTVEETVAMIQSALPKMISIDTRLAPGLWAVRADGSQMEQMLINLMVNAADAMPGGGVLAIETGNVEITHRICESCGEVLSGRFALMKVIDNGQGIDQAVHQRIFEPFFTTKELGKGTGLGLATVYGIVIDHGGHIICHSRPGHGTTFEILLPCRGEHTPPAEQDDIAIEAVKGKGELVLLVDDEEALRELGSIILENNGYRAITAKSGEEALDLYQDQGRDIDLILLDLSMPGMGGDRCMRRILEINPEAKIVILSGYSANGRLKDSLKSGAAWAMSKPVRQAELLSTVRSVLDS